MFDPVRYTPSLPPYIACSADKKCAAAFPAYLYRFACRLEGELDTTQRTLDTAQAEATACKEDLQQKLCVLEAQLNTANDKITTTEAALVKSEAREKELTATNAELSLSKSNAEDSIASLSKELETLRESYGATEESQLDKLCQVSKEAETLRRRVREMAELKARLASAEAQSTLRVRTPIVRASTS
ncbi:hypothetical protein EON66_02225 [archaeon]|nr:MAG: hypothetical protein EON66_02225 [archaeon]